MTIGSELPPGTFIDRRYQIRYVLGRGGFGRTYLAADERRFGDLCVLKEFVPKNQGDSVVAQKLHELFHREAKILHKLNHPQIPKFFAVFEEDDRLFIAQEFINGKTYWKLLQERQQQGRAFSEAEIFHWLCNLLPVLSYLHEQNIVHRDISPDNIMLPKAGQLPVLIDFGVVKQAAPHWYEVSAITPDGSVQASVSVGKLGYAPYEQIRIGQCSPRSDLYALGVTAAVLLTAKPPNHLIDSKSLEWKWQELVSIHPEFVRILEKMMADKPQDRYPSAEAVLEDLQPLQSHFEYYQPEPENEPAPANEAPLTHVATAVLPAAKEQTQLDSSFSHRFVPVPDVSDRSQASSSLQAAPCQAEAVVASEAPGEQSQLGWRSRATSMANVLRYKARSMGHVSMRSPKASVADKAEPEVPANATVNLSTLAAPPTRLTVLVGASQRSRFSIKRVCLLSFLSIVSLGGVAVGMQSPRIASLCEPLNNCTEDQRLQWTYQTAIRQVDRAKKLSESAKTLEDLRNAHQRLVDAVNRLRTLPPSSDLFAQAQQHLPVYHEMLDHMTVRLDKEARALNLLERAREEAKNADTITKAAKNNQEFAQAQSQWRKALATLSAIPDSSLVATQASERLREYDAQLQTVTRKLASLSPVAITQANSPAASPPSPEMAASPTPSAQPPDTAVSTPGKPQLQDRSQGNRQPAPVTPERSSTPSISLAPSPERAATPSPRQDPVAIVPSHPPMYRVAPGSVNLFASQTLNEVSVRLSGAHVNSRGTYVANFMVENSSDRAFGFVPLFAEVRDANGQPVGSRVMIPGSEDALVAPGELLQGEVYLFDRYWDESGTQNLTLVIREGTSGNRNFYVHF